jgi:hypothetical protein
MEPPTGWCSTSDPLLAHHEAMLLRHLRAPHTVFRVPLSADGSQFINTLEITPTRSTNTTLVLIHGFASAMATFVNVLEQLGQKPNTTTIYAIDLPGFGRSWKPDFPAQEAENIWIESLERWRAHLRIPADGLILCAHSFGAYIATLYARRYPTRSQILFEPWGLRAAPPLRSQWPLGLVNPLRLLRLAGPLGLALMRLATGGLFSRTFAGIGEGDEMLLYLYHCNVQCTADAAFLSLASSDYRPLRPVAPAPNAALIIYGADSWIGPVQCSVRAHFVQGAGHQVYAEQPGEFVQAVLEGLREIGVD